ncbi:MAG: protein phosphatase 2C domain-containing protein [Caulobacteraceae bacterium]|nr:protein phosphatase 2C domain-containing protein [Caulobacteraceae bacterium]
MMQKYRYASIGLTHEGLVRPHNEDSHLVREDVGVWIVADGMGGHENGRWASSTVVAAVEGVVVVGNFEQDVAMVAKAIQAANQIIYDASVAAGKRMGSTVVGLVIGGTRFACLWTGDSRIYLLRNGQLTRLTRDHTQVQELLDRGALSAEEAADHPMAHVLSHAVGVEAPMRLDIIADEVGPRDIFLLCSDGLTDVVSEPEIAEQLAGLDPRAAGRRLLELALSRGGPDNVTVVSVACEEMTALTLPGDA